MRNFLYKLFIRHATYCCYQSCLEYFHPESTILDVAIGNGIMLENYHRLNERPRRRATGYQQLLIGTFFAASCGALDPKRD